jgi:predicted SnoaL-like aldol condensation-catalyzing enzyme
MQIGEGSPYSRQFTVALSPVEVSKSVVGVAAMQSGCGYAVLSDTQLVITRNFLPWWCVILAGWMLLFARSWFFFFFSEEQERLLVTIVSDGYQTRVDMQGRAKPEMAGRLHAALTALGGQALGPAVGCQPSPVAAVPARTMGIDVATQERAARALEQAEMERLTKAGLTGSARVTCTPNGSGLHCSGTITASDGSAAEKTWDVEVAPFSGELRWSAPTVRTIPAAPWTGCPRCVARGAELVWCDGCAARLSALRRLPSSNFVTALCRDMDVAIAEGRIDSICAQYSPEYKGHSPSRPAPVDKATFQANTARTATMFPDISGEHLHVVEDGDRVWSDYHLHARGPSGTYELHGVVSYRVNEGLVAESWTYPGLALPA